MLNKTRIYAIKIDQKGFESKRSLAKNIVSFK